MIPTPVVRLIPPDPLACRCGSRTDLIVDDGPTVCRRCIDEGAVMAKATVRRSDTVKEQDHRNREGYWP